MMEWIVEAETLGDLVDGHWTANTKPLVRCKDCKHWHGESENNAVEECDGVMGNIRTTPDFFCAYGERKDDGVDMDI